MPAPLTVLLPPSEGKAAGGRPPGWDPDGGRFGASLGAARRTVAGVLTTVEGGDERLLGARGQTLERARRTNRSLVGAPCLPAGQRYTGVVWDHLGLASASPAARRRAAASVVVLSALAGLVALDDPLPDHRLKFSVSLPPLGRLDRFWREALSETLNDALAGHLVIDLLPAEHRAAWRPEPARYDLRRVVLARADGRPAGHPAKAAKGHLARALLEADDADEALRRWRHDELVLRVRPQDEPIASG